MKGRVLGFDFQANEGQISGEDGQRYRFTPADWKATGRPNPGQVVDFEPQGSRAVGVYSMSGGASPMAGDKNKIVAALLALFLGWLGIHKFYLGKNGAGVIMLLGGTIGWLLILPPVIVGIIAFIEFIVYLVVSDEEFERKYVLGNQSWF